MDGLKGTICHIVLNGTYTEGWNYQENIIPKYHAKMGYRVVQIVSPYAWVNGKIEDVGEERYVNQESVEVIRICPKKSRLGVRFNRYPQLRQILENINPDILFIHDVQFLDTDVIANYLKYNRHCKVYVDNHADLANSAKRWVSKTILHKIIWRHSAHNLLPYVKKFYGVLPARVDFLVEMYGLPVEKCSLLVMGGDDELIENVRSNNIGKQIRKQNKIADDDILIATGGKINQYRPETLNLMKAVIGLNNKRIKLLVFGVVSEALKNEFETLCNNESIIYVGWLRPELTYDYIDAADLIIFPGLHSVMWEQAVAQGKPCVFRDIEGFHHVDLGGNASFIKDTSIEGLQREIREIIDDSDRLKSMKRVAENKGMITFSYRDIAKRCIEN